MKTRVSLPPSKVKAQRRKRRNLLISGIVGGGVLLIAGIISLFWIPAGRVSAITVVGTQTLSTSSIEAYITNELSGNYFFLFPKNNVLLYPKQHIEQDLPQAFATIKTASVHLENLHTIEVDVTERTPDALWCGEAVASSSPCYLLDGSGTIYALAAVYSGDAYVKYFGSLSTSTQKAYLTPQLFESLHALVEALQSKDTPQSVYVDGNNDVHVIFNDGFMLLFSLIQNPGDVVSRFNIALTADPFVSHKLSDFQYLDLRFGDKLYYKLKGQ